MYYTCISNGKGGWAQRWAHWTELDARIHREELILDNDFDEDAVFIEKTE